MSYLNEDIAAQLKTGAIITDKGVDCFFDIWPDKPSNCVMIEELYISDSFMDSSYKRNLKIWTRNENQKVAKDKLQDIYEYLRMPSDGGGFNINGRFVVSQSNSIPLFQFQLNNCYYYGWEIFLATKADSK